MKKNLLFSLILVAAGPLFAADSSLKDDVISAATALGDQKNYSWKTTVILGLLHYSTTEQGKTELDGYTTYSKGPVTALSKGTNTAIKLQANEWRSAAEVLQDTNRRFSMAKASALKMQNFKTPAVQAANLAAKAQNLKAGTNGISGDLAEADVEALLGDGVPAAANRHVTLAFWITDGKLSKYQWHATGTVKIGGSDGEMDRTATTEIMDVNTTKIDVPDDARKKLE